MKKFFMFILSFSLVLGLAACGNNTTGNMSDSVPTETQGTSEPETTPESDAAVPGTEALTEEPMQSDGGRTLVVYFSATGNTETIADYIVAATGADVFELEPVNAYTDEDLNYNDDSSRVVREHDNPDEQKVELVNSTVENWNEYNTVFVGYPIWWHIAAWPVNGFIEANDFTGKTVIPFCTSGSSDIGESGELLEEMAGTGNWLEGRRFSSNVSESDVRSWITDLGLQSESIAATQGQADNLQISITMGETTIYADLYDNELAREFMEQLPQTISMQRVGGGREFYGSLEKNLNYDEKDSQTTFENGDIAYWYSGNGLCLLYNNQVEEPEIDSGIIVFGKITSDLAVFDGLEDTVEMSVDVYTE